MATFNRYDHISSKISKIPTMNHRKELVRTAVKNNDPPKLLETRKNKVELKTVKKENDTKKGREGMQSKSNTEEVKVKTKVAFTENIFKQKSSCRNVTKPAIENLSKDTVKLLKKEEFQEYKLRPETEDDHGMSAGMCAFANDTDGASTSDNTNIKRKPGENSRPVPSQMVQPKKHSPHAGLVLQSNVRKTAVFRAFSSNPNPSKLRRSRSEYDPDFERPIAQNIRRQNQIDEGRNKTYQNPKTTKSAFLSKSKEPLIENKLPKEIPVHPRKPLAPSRMVKNLPVENKTTKPTALKSKPLKRSNTIHALNSVPVKKSVSTTVQKDIYKSKIEIPSIPENLKSPILNIKDIEKIKITPKKDVPHGGINFKVRGTRKTKIFGIFSNVE